MSFGWINNGSKARADIEELLKLLKNTNTINIAEKNLTVEINATMIKEAVKCVSTNPVIFSGLHIIDGYQLNEGDRVLVTAQGDSAQNGIYIASNNTWVRSTDCNNSNNIKPKIKVSIIHGNQFEDTTWELDIEGTINVGITPLLFRVSEFSAQNGKEYGFTYSEWILSGDNYYINIPHFLGTLRPDITIYETDEFGETSLTDIDRIEIIDKNNLKLWVPKIDRVDTRFSGYVFIEPNY